MQCPEAIWQFWWTLSVPTSAVLAVPDAASVPKVEAEGSPLDQFCCMVLVAIHG